MLPRRHQRTLNAILQRPTRGDVRWHDFVALVKALGGSVETRRGGSSRLVRVGGRRAVFHEPHPGSEMPKGAVDSARRLIRLALIVNDNVEGNGPKQR